MFYNLKKIKEYQKFFLEHLKQKEKYTKLMKYIKNYWFNKSPVEYNYSEFIERYKDNNIYMNKLYLTNNIVESIHGKLNYFLPKKITNPRSFIICLNNIFINDAINNDTFIRYDYKSQSIVMLIEKENLNNEYKWINYEIFKKYLNLVINKDNIPENECCKIIKIIEEDLIDNYIDIEEDNINDSETLKEENIEDCDKDSDESIYDNKIEKNLNNDIESFVRYFNQLNIEKANEDNNLTHIDKIEESYINKELLNPLRVIVQKKINPNKSFVNDDIVKKKPILYPKHDYEWKKTTLILKVKVKELSH